MNTHLRKSVNRWLVTMAIVAFVAIIVMRLFPMYQEYYKVVQVMDSMQQELKENRLTRQQTMTLLEKRFKFSGIDSVKRENIEIYRGRNNAYITRIVVDYEVRNPFIANLDTIGNFHNEINVEQ